VVLNYDLRHGDGIMTLITFEDGKPVMKDDGKVGTEQACCCSEECCNCDSVFNFYANGRILDGTNFSLDGFDTGFLAYIPGLGFGETWENSGCVTDAECDEDGYLLVRVNLHQRSQVFVDPSFLDGQIIESRFYKFDLSGGACGLLTGDPIAVPEGASTGSDSNVCGGTTPGVAGNIDGDVIRYVIQIGDGGFTDPALLNSAPLHFDWDGIVVEASCQIQCASIQCQDAEADCGDDCECQPVEIGIAGFPAGEPDERNVFHCILNPLP